MTLTDFGWALLYWPFLAILGAPIVFVLGPVLPRRRWAWFLVLAYVAAIPISMYFRYNAPLTGAYDPEAAHYWIAKAATETERAPKEAILRRIATSSPEYGWFIASKSIERVESRKERCLLRTILAGFHEVKMQEQLIEEMKRECAVQ